MDDETRDALLMFQTAHGLPATGEVDDTTRAELEKRHDKVHAQPRAETNGPPGETPGTDDVPEEVVIDPEEDDRRFREFDQQDEEEDQEEDEE